jgi:Zn finger protein HypA/HybF involved in hydrogenase expression
MSNAYISTVIGDKAAAALRAVISTGLWGDTESEVVGGMVLQCLREAIAHGVILAALEGREAKPDPAAPKCEHCGDGLKLISDETPDGMCPKCG